MPVVQAQPHHFIQEKQSAQAKPITMVTTSMEMEPKGFIVRKQHLSAVFPRMILGCMTCTAMYGSGVKIGMVQNTTRQVPLLTRRAHPLAAIVCFAAGVGATTPGTAGLLIGAGIRLATAAPTTVFVFSWTYNPLLFVFLHFIRAKRELQVFENGRI